MEECGEKLKNEWSQKKELTLCAREIHRSKKGWIEEKKCRAKVSEKDIGNKKSQENNKNK